MEMSEALMQALCNGGRFAAVGLAAIGSALGTGTAGQAAVGAMKKCYAQNKPASFLLVALAGFPLSQTLYGLVMMLLLTKDAASWPQALLIGILGGAGMGVSAWYQGKAAAAACDSLGETGKGFANYVIILGIIETVAIFTLVFALLV
nr:hypothetical protein [Victivallis sp. Marseille-Q1083]